MTTGTYACLARTLPAAAVPRQPGPGRRDADTAAPTSITIVLRLANRLATSSRRLLPWLAVAALLASCAPLLPRGAKGASFVPSPNFDERRPNLVVIHHTSNDTLQQALDTLTSPRRKVSAHYLIGRDGSVLQLVDERERAWHAGVSWWGGLTDVNSASLGIELDNNGREAYAEAQIAALLALLADIRERYRIPAANVVGHADVAPTRKDDPSAWFPWKTLAEQGFGLWCDAPLQPAPDGYDLALALTALGYDPATPEASRRAFRLHHARGDPPLADDDEKALAHCLLQKKASPSR